jgi:prepilin-type N-terminal cleavage/methylation domain-containing protein
MITAPNRTPRRFSAPRTVASASAKPRSGALRAFTLTELLFALALFAIASALAMKLFTGSMRVIRGAPKTQDHFAAVDRMSASLRQDVWSAATIDTPDANTLVVANPDQWKVQWTFAEHSVTRKTPDGEQRWPIDVPISVSRAGPQVILQTPNGDSLRFTSQLLVVNGGTP